MEKIARRWRYFHCNLQNLEETEQFLENQAREGWYVSQYFAGFFSFKKGKSKKKQYYVDVFEKKKWNNSYLNDKNDAFLKRYAKSGWSFLFANNRFQVLENNRSEGQKPKLDETVRVESIYKSYLKENFVIYLFVFIMAICNMLSGFLGLVNMLSSLSSFLYVGAWTLIAIYIMGYILINQVWCRKARIAAKLKETIPRHPVEKYKKIGIIIAMIATIASIIGFFVESSTFESGNAFHRCVIVLAVLGLYLGFQYIYTKKRVAVAVVCATVIFCVAIEIIAVNASSIFQQIHNESVEAISTGSETENRTVYSDAIPVTLLDIGCKVDESIPYSTYHEVYGRFLISQDYYSEAPVELESNKDKPALYYVIYQTNNGYLYNQILEEECFGEEEESSYKIFENREWNAKTVYSIKPDLETYTYIFLYDDKIIRMNTTFELDSNQIKTIACQE